MSRRIVGIVLPNFLWELAQEQVRVKQFAASAGAPPADTRSSGTQQADTHGGISEIGAVVVGDNPRLDAVGPAAKRYGVRPGQTLVEARALVSQLQLIVLTPIEVQLALERICESVLRFGTTVAYESPDTAWLDISGVAHLFGGEAALCEELLGALGELGYRARLAVASGPIFAQALARWGSLARGQAALVVSEQAGAEYARHLPVQALPVSSEVRTWLAQLGIINLGDLSKIPREYASHRLGEQASAALDLVVGVDERPLRPYCPVSLPIERISWDEAVTGCEPLLFALRGLASRIGARLEGRGLAAQRVRLTVTYDTAIARFRGTDSALVQEYDLAAPLFRAEELWKVMSSRLSRTQLAAPSVGLVLEVLQLTHAHQRQLELSNAQSKLSGATPEALAVLFGELSADIGRRQFGLLRVGDSHRPEKVSLLQPITDKQISGKSKKSRSDRVSAEPARSRKKESGPGPVNTGTGRHPVPNRLLRTPLPICGPIRVGSLITVGRQVFSIKSTQFEQRLDFVEWWSQAAVSRDYVRVWLESGNSGMEALVFVDRSTGQRFLQALYD